MRLIKQTAALAVCLLSLIAQAWIIATLFQINSAAFMLSFCACLVLSGILVYWLMWPYPKFVLPQKSGQQVAWLAIMLQQLCTKLSIPVAEVRLLRSPGINAFAVADLRDRGVIFLNEQIISLMTQDEVEAILAHELCHIAKGHTSLMSLVQGMTTCLTMPVAMLIAAPLSLSRQSNGWQHRVLQTNSIILFLLFPITSILILVMTRRWEFAADRCAANLVGRQTYVHVLRCLYGSFFQHPNLLAIFPRQEKSYPKLNFSEDNYLSHPSLTQRINALYEAGS